MEKERKICAAYIRVSTHDQEEFSPDSQIKKVREYAKANGMVLPEEFIFRDDGISGRTAEKRPEFLRMIATAKEKPRLFDCILVWKFSRFARNQEESIVYKSLLKKENDIDVISISEPVVEGPFGGLIERIIEWFDAFYSANLAVEVRRGMTERVSRGLPVSVAPLGYRYGTGQTLEILPEEAEVVRMIYRDFLAGSGTITIAKKLNRLKIPTKRGNTWENRTVRYILRNPTYIGKVRWCPQEKNDYHKSCLSDSTMLVEGQHEPIISQADFDKAQDMMCERVKKYKGSGKRSQREEVSWPLQGLVRCGSCGATLSRSGTGANCSAYVHGRCTVSHYIGRDALEELVNLAIRQQLNSLDIEITQQEQPAKDEEQRQLQQCIQKEREALRRHKEAYAAGVDTLQEYQGNKAECQERIQALQSQLDKLAQRKPVDKEAYAQHALNLLDQLENRDLSPQEKNSLYRSFVDHITFHKSPRAVEIVYWA